jgi:hypothetical protein
LLLTGIDNENVFPDGELLAGDESGVASHATAVNIGAGVAVEIFDPAVSLFEAEHCMTIRNVRAWQYDRVLVA